MGATDGEVRDRRIELVGVRLTTPPRKISMAWPAMPRATPVLVTTERGRPPRRGPSPCSVSSATRAASRAGVLKRSSGTKSSPSVATVWLPVAAMPIASQSSLSTSESFGTRAIPTFASSDSS